MGNCVQTKRKSFVARKYGPSHPQREEPMFNGLKRAQSDMNRSGSIKKRKEPSLPRRKDLENIYIDIDTTETKSIVKHRKVQSPKSNELSEFMRPVQIDESADNSKMLGMRSIVEGSVQHASHHSRINRPTLRPLEKSPSDVRRLPNQLPSMSNNNTAEKMDEVLELSIVANRMNSPIGGTSQARSMFFHSQQPPRPIVEQVRHRQLDKEYLRERINDPIPPPLNPEADRIDTKALKDIEINIHLEPPTHLKDVIGSQLSPGSYKAHLSSSQKPTAHKQEPDQANFRTPQHPSFIARKEKPSINTSEIAIDPPKSFRTPHATRIFLHDGYFHNLEPKPEFAQPRSPSALLHGLQQ